jgi:hypothetical protein
MAGPFAWCARRRILRVLLRLLTGLIGCVVVLALTAWGSAVASADSLSVSVSPSSVVWTGPVQATVTVTGATALQPDSAVGVFAVWYEGGSGSCGATPSSPPPSGQPQEVIGDPFSPQASDGSFSDSSNPLDIELPGPSGSSDLICAWGERQDGSVFAAAGTSLLVRRPHATLSIAQPTATPTLAIHFSATYSLETGSAVLDVVVYDDFHGTHPCPTEGGQVPYGLAPVYGRAIGGGKPLSGSVTASTPPGLRLAAGRWRVCGYISYGGLSPAGDPIGAVFASSSVSVIVPSGTRASAPCQVPNVKHKTLARARSLLKSAHCQVGRVVSHKYGKKPRRVISQSPKPGTILPHGSSVSLVVG